MSIASPTDADYTSTITSIRDCIRFGTRLDDYKMRLALAVVKDAVARFTTNNDAVTDLTDEVTAQMVILQAKGTNDASVEIDAADAALSALVTAATAAAPTVPTYASSAVDDG